MIDSCIKVCQHKTQQCVGCHWNHWLSCFWVASTVVMQARVLLIFLSDQPSDINSGQNNRKDQIISEQWATETQMSFENLFYLCKFGCTAQTLCRQTTSKMYKSMSIFRKWVEFFFLLIRIKQHYPKSMTWITATQFRQYGITSPLAEPEPPTC